MLLWILYACTATQTAPAKSSDVTAIPAEDRSHKPAEIVSHPRARIVQRLETGCSRKRSPYGLHRLCVRGRGIPDTPRLRYSLLPKTLTFSANSTSEPPPTLLPKNLTVTVAVSKMSIAPDTYEILWLTSSATRLPQNLTCSTCESARCPNGRSRKISPSPKRGTAKNRFSPPPVGFPANQYPPGSRKSSPLMPFCATGTPEKAHL